MLLETARRPRGLGDAPSWFAGAGLVNLLLLVGVAFWLDREHRRR